MGTPPPASRSRAMAAPPSTLSQGGDPARIASNGLTGA